jgi:hypothetical protein
VLLHPLWLALPFLMVAWGYFGDWYYLYWAPCLALVVLATAMSVGLCPPEQFLFSRPGWYLTTSTTVMYAGIMVLPLCMQPICGSCIPFGDVLYLTAAGSVFTLMEVCSALTSASHCACNTAVFF